MKFRKKPVVIEAEQFFPDRPWPAGVVEIPGKIRDTIESRSVTSTTFMAWVGTLEGGHLVAPGDWIITGVQGEKYPCKPDIFEATYERVKEAPHEPCTGISASWCHNCGDCTCPRYYDDNEPINDPEAIAKAYERRGECPLHGASSQHAEAAMTWPGPPDPALPPIERWHGDRDEIWAWLASEDLDTMPVTGRRVTDLLRLVRRAKLDALAAVRQECVNRRELLRAAPSLGASICVKVVEKLIRELNTELSDV